MGEPVEPATGKRWQRFGYWVHELRPGVFRVEDKSGQAIGFVTAKGSRFQARSGYGQSLATSEVLGSFNSARAALRLVAGHHELQELRDEVRRQVIELERKDPNSTRRVR